MTGFALDPTTTVRPSRRSRGPGFYVYFLVSTALALLFVLPHSADATTNSLTNPSPFSSDGTPPSPEAISGEAVRLGTRLEDGG